MKQTYFRKSFLIARTKHACFSSNSVHVKEGYEISSNSANKITKSDITACTKVDNETLLYV
jgi:hypothetical protein